MRTARRASTSDNEVSLELEGIQVGGDAGGEVGDIEGIAEQDFFSILLPQKVPTHRTGRFPHGHHKRGEASQHRLIIKFRQPFGLTKSHHHDERDFQSPLVCASRTNRKSRGDGRISEHRQPTVLMFRAIDSGSRIPRGLAVSDRHCTIGIRSSRGHEKARLIWSRRSSACCTKPRQLVDDSSYHRFRSLYRDKELIAGIGKTYGIVANLD